MRHNYKPYNRISSVLLKSLTLTISTYPFVSTHFHFNSIVTKIVFIHETKSCVTDSMHDVQFKLLFNLTKSFNCGDIHKVC